MGQNLLNSPKYCRSSVCIVTLTLILSQIGFTSLAMAESIPLAGQLEMGGDVDRHGRPASGDSRFHFSISGEAAKAMYNTLSGPATKDDCSGFIRKSEGKLNCYAKTIQQQYSCTFAINIKQSELEASVPSCR